MLEDQRVERKSRVEGKWDVGRVEREGRGRNPTVPKNKYSFFKLEPLGDQVLLTSLGVRMEYCSSLEIGTTK